MRRQVYCIRLSEEAYWLSLLEASVQKQFQVAAIWEEEAVVDSFCMQLFRIDVTLSEHITHLTPALLL